MKIAILGWGSLIWDPRNLEIDKTVGQNGWFPDGPMLPIEFSRISQDGRLTLVIDPDGAEVRTLYSISKYEKIEEAVLNLKERECRYIKDIGVFSKADSQFSNSNFQFKQNIELWIKEMVDIDAVIWTDLMSNFSENIGYPFNEENVIKYLKNLSSHELIAAEKYVRLAPSVVKTSIRDLIEKELGWTKNN